MSLIATGQMNGPSTTVAISSSRTTPLATASRCRRKRRHASCHGDVGRFLRGWATADAGASAVRDAGVEPAIDDISQEVEEDDETGDHEGHGHHDRRVV